MDKEIYDVIRRKRQEKYVKLLTILTEVEDKYNIDIKNFYYEKSLVSVEIGERNWLEFKIKDF